VPLSDVETPGVPASLARAIEEWLDMKVMSAAFSIIAHDFHGDDLRRGDWPRSGLAR
jgi:hypothetical protein